MINLEDLLFKWSNTHVIIAVSIAMINVTRWIFVVKYPRDMIQLRHSDVSGLQNIYYVYHIL